MDLLGITQRKRTSDFYLVTDPITKKREGGNPKGTSNPNNCNPLLKSKLTSPIEVAGKPSFSAVLKYCGKTPDGVYPLIDRKCVPKAIFGKCYLGDKCPFKHRILNDSQASKVLETPKKFIEHTEAMKQG